MFGKRMFWSIQELRLRIFHTFKIFEVRRSRYMYLRYERYVMFDIGGRWNCDVDGIRKAISLFQHISSWTSFENFECSKNSILYDFCQLFCSQLPTSTMVDGWKTNYQRQTVDLFRKCLAFLEQFAERTPRFRRFEHLNIRQFVKIEIDNPSRPRSITWNCLPPWWNLPPPVTLNKAQESNSRKFFRTRKFEKNAPRNWSLSNVDF